MFRSSCISRTLEANGKTLTLGERTLVMGILNVTHDSFSDGGRHQLPDQAMIHARMMIEQGADLVDVGGESTRPGAQKVDAKEELDRVLPLISALAKETDTLISIDSYKARVAHAALSAGAHIINDVWGFQHDSDMAKVAAEFQVPAILMHNQEGTDYPGDILDQINLFFDRSIELALKKGLDEERIILDPGIGFGKTPEQNIKVMQRLDEIKAWGFPVLLGTSRKSMIGKILDLPVDQRLEGTLATNALGIMAGCEIIRVHDIMEHVRLAKVMDSLLKGRLDG